MSEIRELRRKKRAKPSQKDHFSTFFYKKPLYLLKTKNACGFFIVKISTSTIFTCLRKNKNAHGGTSKSNEFRFENSLNVKDTLKTWKT